MANVKFEAILTLLVPQVVQLIQQHFGWNEISTSQKFYASEVYALLEQEDTAVWHFSPLTLCNMFAEEYTQGSFVIPEEA